MSNSGVIARVAVEKTAFSFDRLFDYSVPDFMADSLKPGCRVTVPFGRGGKPRQGMVMSVERQRDFESSEKRPALKSVAALLDKTPVLTEEMLNTARFISDRCFCTLYEAVKAMLPSGINYKIETFYSPAENSGDVALSIYEKQVTDYLSRRNSPVKEEVLLEAVPAADEGVLTSLTEKGAVVKSREALRRVGDAGLKMAALCEGIDITGETFTKKQSSVVDILQTAGCASVKEICYYTGVTKAVLDGLERRNIIFYYEEEVFRTPKLSNVKQPASFELTPEQNKAYLQIKERLKEGKPAVSLLYGITGSGKTSVFLKLIEGALDENKGVIVMVPEISLTPQFISLFCSKFGKKVAVFHSGLSMGERLDEFKRVKNGEALIAIGTRSAVFAPFEKIGLIIIDEEQESTYKSESTPRFHAREVAKFRVNQHNALLLLSSATPSVESFYLAEIGRYSLSSLKTRYGGATLPRVEIADMNLEAGRGNFSEFSTVLLENLQYNLEHNRQSILLLNRRGYNVYVSCPHCQQAVTCPNCSITMTYHSANNRLMCHYCGYSLPFENICPSCGGKGLRLSGAGTQMAQAEIEKILPGARVLRMDTDSTMKRYSHERKLAAFAKGDYDILIGTQMVAKGLDFPNVTLVGVLNADRMLYADDYRSFERTFSLLTQVVGRSGRGDKQGMAVIQTYTPENNIISMAASQDYEEFFRGEINIRKAMLYPPFADICMVGFSADSRQAAESASKEFMKILVDIAKKDYSGIPLRILGPSPASVMKVSNKYRYKIIIKCRNDSLFRALLKRALIDYEKEKNRGISVFADMNPASF